MQKKITLLLLIICISTVVVTGCTNTVSSNITAQATITPIQSTLPDTVTSTATLTSVPSATPTGCVITATGCTPFPPSPTIPPYGIETMQNEPIIGTYIFDLSQFNSNDVERLDYFSPMGSSEYNYKVVPLDISPDIKWTFRDDGVLLFFQNNITSSNESLRSAWKISNGVYLRNGTWEKVESGDDGITYRVNRGSHVYTIVYDNNEVRLTQPIILNMTKIN
jgi:hypothetical protein